MKAPGPEKIKSLIKKEARRAFDLGLVWGRSGNMSMRKDASSFYVTASGSSLGEMTAVDMVLCRLDKEKPAKASMEWMLHGGIYQSRGDVNAVLHSQPPYSTLIACSKNKKIETSLIPESIAYIKDIEIVPYAHPGSTELADNCAKAAKKSDVLLLENHGVVTCGPSIEDALNKALTLEFLCRMIIQAKAAGIELKSVPAAKAREFLEQLKELRSLNV